MKLDAIDLHNHLSHADTHVEFNGTRLAAFVGSNGAGKSALLEALKYALYDDGRAKTDQLVRLGETDMSAMVSFTFAGSLYRVTRGRTTKGAGKSYLELAVQAADGSWTTLSGDDIRDTQAKIQALLGVDADTFGTAVFLGQGEANRFAEATAGERKRILGQVLGLEVYARAEARARDEARTLEATTEMDRSTVARLADAIADAGDPYDVATQRSAEIHGLAQLQTAAAAERDRIQARLTELAGEIAKGDAAAAEVTRLEEERASLAERYRRERTIVANADAAIAGARITLGQSEVIAAAVDQVEAARAELEQLEAGEAESRRLGAELDRRRSAFHPADAELRAARASWTADLRYAQDRLSELIAAVNALEPVICRKCGTANVVDQADLQGQLNAARARVAEVEAAAPDEPMSHSRERVAIQRLEERRTAAAWDPEPLRIVRDRLANLERLAARAGEMAAAEASRKAANAAALSAKAELEAIDAAGQALRGRLEAAKAATAGTAALLEERADAEVRIRFQGDVLERLTGERRTAERGLAEAEANVARLEQLQRDRDEVLARLTDADVDLARLRRLVAAFGVTGIPARIIEGVLPELSGYANELLGELRPGMVLEIRAQREKKSGKGVVEALDLIVRDDVGERPLAVFSGGERMSVSLAIATALSRLVARRAGTAIRTLVIDEPDGLDTEARRSFGQALRVLAHHGELERVVLVSHHPDLAEYADDVWQVTKSGTGSTVELVA